MQEIHSTMGGGGGGGGRFFAAAAGDRRLRPHQNHHQNQQALKCPRCDSLNTKFCYYNNYNLSQPRHFCKNCRRYWTKGGVLRNVPVGGGCRKSKRSNNKPTNKNTETSQSENKDNNSHSSSESSSLTAATTAEAVPAPAMNSESSNNNNMQESKLLIPSNSSNPVLESVTLEQGVTGDCGIFSEIGSFTSLINSTNEALAFGFVSGASGSGSIPDATSFQWQHQKVVYDHQHEGELKLPESLGGGGSLLDHGAVDLSALQGKNSHAGFGALDWHAGADQGLFDLPSTVDQAYWSHTHWSDQDNSTLFHLP